MKDGIKAFVLTFIVMTMISCAFPATGQGFYVGFGGGVSYAGDLNTKSLDKFTDKYSANLRLQNDIKKFGTPSEIYLGWESSSSCLSIEFAKIGGVTAKVKTPGVALVFNEQYSGKFDTLLLADAYTFGVLCDVNITPDVSIFAKVAAAYIVGNAQLSIPDFKGPYVGIKAEAWSGEATIGVKFKVTPNTDLVIKGGSIGTLRTLSLRGNIEIKL